ncbi:MAG: nucleotidyltransferase domain-containing protein [Thermoplasmata archaeon]
MRPADAFPAVQDYVTVLSDFRRPWMIAGGWAIDLFLRRSTRGHEDVDVAIYRRDQRDIRAYLRRWEFEKVVEGRRETWREGEWLNLPVHEIHGHRSGSAPREIELLLNEATDEEWVFRRDARITRPLSKVVLQTLAGVPFLAPEIVLLYKAKDPKPKDLEDFERTRSRLGFRRRLWLRGALETCHPRHPWIARL